VLGFHRDEFRFQSAVGHQGRKVLHDVGLGGDGIRRDGFGRASCTAWLTAMETSMPTRFLWGIMISSTTILMHPVTHSLTQMPQPLQ